MAIIASASYTGPATSLILKFTDMGVKGRNKNNPVKLNIDGIYDVCQHVQCEAPIYLNNKSGLCRNHKEHQHDIKLELWTSSGTLYLSPAHENTIDALKKKAKEQHYDLYPLFMALLARILGNIPDVSTLAGDTVHEGFVPPGLQMLVDQSMSAIVHILPESDLEELSLSDSDKYNSISLRGLVLVTAGLVLCEEANRGDRWFWRTIKKQEENTEYLGGAMPIAYWAPPTFGWGNQHQNFPRAELFLINNPKPCFYLLLFLLVRLIFVKLSQLGYGCQSLH